jgi:hypothetical protein
VAQPSLSRDRALFLRSGTGSLVLDLRRRTDRVASEEVIKEVNVLRAAADQSMADTTAAGMADMRSAKVFFSSLTGYSNLIARLLAQAYAHKELQGTAVGALAKRVSELKEIFGKQRAFLAGVGCLVDAELAALPARALLFSLQTQEQQVQVDLNSPPSLHAAQQLSRPRLSHHGHVRATWQTKILDEVRVALQKLPAMRQHRFEVALRVDNERMDALMAWLQNDDFDIQQLRVRLDSPGFTIEGCWLAWTAHIDKVPAERTLYSRHRRCCDPTHTLDSCTNVTARCCDPTDTCVSPLVRRRRPASPRCRRIAALGRKRWSDE